MNIIFFAFTIVIYVHCFMLWCVHDYFHEFTEIHLQDVHEIVYNDGNKTKKYKKRRKKQPKQRMKLIFS